VSLVEGGDGPGGGGSPLVRFSALDIWGRRLDHDAALGAVGAPLRGWAAGGGRGEGGEGDDEGEGEGPAARALPTLPALVPWNVYGHPSGSGAERRFQYAASIRHGVRPHPMALWRVLTGATHRDGGWGEPRE